MSGTTPSGADNEASTSDWDVLHGEALALLQTLPSESVQTCITSPPYYGLRNYGTETWVGGDPDCDHQRPDYDFDPKTNYERQRARDNGIQWECQKCGAAREDHQIGLEESPRAFVEHLAQIMREVHRVLRPDGTLWLNLGDSYSGSGVNDGSVSPGLSKAATRDSPVRRPGATKRWSCPLKPKDLQLIPYEVAAHLRDVEGWHLRADIIWNKPNPMPEPVKDRPVVSHEHIFLLTKRPRYLYDHLAAMEPAATSHWPGIGPAHAGIRDRGEDYSEMTVHEGRRYRTSWWIATTPRNWDFCEACGTLFVGKHERSAIRIQEKEDERGNVVKERWCPCGSKDDWVAHHAAFPLAIPRTCLKAATSDAGSCPSCGAPWERLTEKLATEVRGGAPSVPRVERGYLNRQGQSQNDRAGFTETLWRTNGWQPSCACDAGPPVPQIVLDPFAGSGTTGLVALEMGRRFIGMDLNQNYCTVARERLSRVHSALQAEIDHAEPQMSLLQWGSTPLELEVGA